MKISDIIYCYLPSTLISLGIWAFLSWMIIQPNPSLESLISVIFVLVPAMLVALTTYYFEVPFTPSILLLPTTLLSIMVITRLFNAIALGSSSAFDPYNFVANFIIYIIVALPAFFATRAVLKLEKIKI